MTETAYCAHLSVIYLTRPVGNSAVRGWWECSDCLQKFEPVPAHVSILPGPLTTRKVKAILANCGYSDATIDEFFPVTAPSAPVPLLHEIGRELGIKLGELKAEVANLRKQLEQTK